MRILITGGSGFLGQALSKALIARGEHVIVWSRDTSKHRDNKTASAWVASLDDINESVDAVINLAGANLFAGLWTRARKETLRASRIDTTKTLMDWLGRQEKAPRVLLSGSAIGFYGNCADDSLTEQAPQGGDWAAQLVADWESATTTSANLKGLRVVYLRTGLVLGNGGLLKPLLPLFKLGMGGSLGDGQFWFSWIHEQDWVNATIFLLDHESAAGPFNLCSPTPVRYKQFAQALGQTLHRPVYLTPPGWLLKLILGEQANLLMSSTKALPQGLQDLAYQWHYTEIDKALAAIQASIK